MFTSRLARLYVWTLFNEGAYLT